MPTKLINKNFNATDVANLVLSKRPATFTRIVYESSPEVIASVKNNVQVTKRTSCVVRLNLRRSHTQKIMAKNNGKIIETSLPWGQYEVPNVIIEHKGKRYLRCNPVMNPRFKPVIEFFVNGQSITKDELLSMNILTSAGKKRAEEEQHQDVFNVPVEQIRALSISIKEN